ncbi:hypothetical protein IV102_37855 [bacterium]|nr:hypothetical protein [bacterium]
MRKERSKQLEQSLQINQEQLDKTGKSLLKVRDKAAKRAAKVGLSLADIKNPDALRQALIGPVEALAGDLNILPPVKKTSPWLRGLIFLVAILLIGPYLGIELGLVSGLLDRRVAEDYPSIVGFFAVMGSAIVLLSTSAAQGAGQLYGSLAFENFNQLSPRKSWIFVCMAILLLIAAISSLPGEISTGFLGLFGVAEARAEAAQIVGINATVSTAAKVAMLLCSTLILGPAFWLKLIQGFQDSQDVRRATILAREVQKRLKAELLKKPVRQAMATAARLELHENEASNLKAEQDRLNQELVQCTEPPEPLLSRLRALMAIIAAETVQFRAFLQELTDQFDPLRVQGPWWWPWRRIPDPHRRPSKVK